MKLTLELVLWATRIVMMVLGTYLGSNGWASEEDTNNLTAAVIVLVGILWSLWTKIPKRKKV